jgi:hypothetical protein
MNEYKYVMANIKIPIEIKENGVFEPLEQYMDIIFEIINSLPEKHNNNYTGEFIQKQIFQILKSKPVDQETMPELFISNDELQTKITKNSKKNFTFRNKNNSTSNYTRKI